MKATAQPTQQAAAARAWPWASAAWLSVPEAEVEAHPDRHDQQPDRS